MNTESILETVLHKDLIQKISLDRHNYRVPS